MPFFVWNLICGGRKSGYVGVSGKDTFEASARAGNLIKNAISGGEVPSGCGKKGYKRFESEEGAKNRGFREGVHFRKSERPSLKIAPQKPEEPEESEDIDVIEWPSISNDAVYSPERQAGIRRQLEDKLESLRGKIQEAEDKVSPSEKDAIEAKNYVLQSYSEPGFERWFTVARGYRKIIEQLIEVKDAIIDAAGDNLNKQVRIDPDKLKIYDPIEDETINLAKTKSGRLNFTAREILSAAKQLYLKTRKSLAKSVGQLGQINANIAGDAGPIRVMTRILERIEREERKREEEEESPRTRYLKEYRNYIDWALELEGMPNYLRECLEFATTRSEFPGSSDIDQRSESKRVEMVARGARPLAHTEGSVRKVTSKMIPELVDYVNGWPIPGGGTLWYENKPSDSGKRTKRNTMAYRIAHCYLVNEMVNSKVAHPAIYAFIKKMLLGGPKEDAVNAANSHLRDEKPGAEIRKKGLLQKIIDGLKYRIRIMIDKPVKAGVMHRLLNKLTSSDYKEGWQEVQSMAESKRIADALGHVLVEDGKFTEEEIDILKEIVFDPS